MATTAQLQKASQKGQEGGVMLNAFSRYHYIQALEAAGQTGIRSLSKVELWKRVRAAGIAIKPGWQN